MFFTTSLVPLRSYSKNWTKFCIRIFYWKLSCFLHFKLTHILWHFSFSINLEILRTFNEHDVSEIGSVSVIPYNPVNCPTLNGDCRELKWDLFFIRLYGFTWWQTQRFLSEFGVFLSFKSCKLTDEVKCPRTHISLVTHLHKKILTQICLFCFFSD
jgi:hypothetical protein